MADDTTAGVAYRSPEPMTVGQFLSGGYLVVAVGDRQIALVHPGSHARVHIDLPAWPDGPDGRDQGHPIPGPGPASTPGPAR